MKNKILGLGFLVGGAAAIYFFYKKSQNVDLGEAPELEYKEIEKEPITVIDGNPVYMTKEAAQKIIYDVKSLEDNRFYLNPNEMYTEEYFETESGKKLKETLAPLTNINVGSLDFGKNDPFGVRGSNTNPDAITNINNLGKLGPFNVLELNAQLKSQGYV
jgi:hypothetical protein